MTGRSFADWAPEWLYAGTKAGEKIDLAYIDHRRTLRIGLRAFGDAKGRQGDGRCRKKG